MIIRVTGKTTLSQVGVDKMDLLLQNGDTIVVDADSGSSDIEDGILHTKMKGVTFDDEYSNGRISELKGAKVAAAYIYQLNNDIGIEGLNDPNVLQLTSVEVEDGEDTLQIAIDVQPKFVFVED